MRLATLVAPCLCLVLGPAVLVPAAQAQDWTAIDLGTTADLFALSNSYLPNRWVVGDGGFAARSNTDRTQWTTIDVETDAPLYSVAEPTGSMIWMGAGHGVVRLVVYAGLFERDLPTQEDFQLVPRSTSDAIAIGDGGKIYVTTNTGNDWNPVESGTSADLHAATGAGARAWIVGDAGTILRSEEGFAWTPLESGTTANLYGIAQPHTDWNRLYAVGEAGTILRTFDGGETWDARPSGTTATLRAISFSKESEDHLVAAGSGGTVLRSTDGGENWCRLEAPPIDLYAVDAVSDSEFLLAGPGGMLFRTTNGDIPCPAPSGMGEEASLSAGLRLEAPFPQPSRFSALFRITPGISGGAHEAQVFDLSGRLVLDDPEVASAPFSGGPTITIDTRSLATGVYLLRVRSDRQEAVRRFVVLR